MQLYYFKSMNPRKACAIAKHLASPVEYVPLDARKGEHKSAAHRARNPNGRVPVLVDGERSIWESVAIMVHLASKAHSDMWPTDDPSKLVDVMRWVSWDAFEFAPHAGSIYFQSYIRPTLFGQDPDKEAIAAAMPEFQRSAKILDAHLAGREFVVGDSLTIADFCLGVLLPDAVQNGLPITDYRNIERWNERLLQIPAWRDPWPE